MKKLYALVIIICVFIAHANAQVTFQKTIGGAGSDGPQCIQATFDGGYIIAGATTSFGVDSGDAYIVKTDINANITWSKTFGGVSAEVFNDVKQTSDSGYIMVGMTKSFGPGLMNILVVKINSAGNLIWSNVYGGTIEQNGYSIQQTADGGYVLCGWTTSFSGGAYVIRLDSGGGIIWTNIYGGFYDSGYDIEETTDGGFILTGDNFDTGDIFLIKTNSTGIPDWSITYGTLGGDNGFSVQQTDDGGYIVCGSSYSQDMYLLKTDNAGSLLWSKTYGGSSGELGLAVQQTTDGGYILTGGTNSFGISGNAVYLVRTNGSGNVLWSKTFGGTGFNTGVFVQQSIDNGYMVAGSTDYFASGISDIYLIKTDSMGNSGCSQSNPATIETSVVTNTANLNISYLTGGTSVVPILNTGSGGTITTLCTSVSLNDITSSNSFQISPNPVIDNLTLYYPDHNSISEIRIYNLLGEIQNLSVTMIDKNIIDVSNLSEGIYVIEVYSSNTLARQKFIKQ